MFASIYFPFKELLNFSMVSPSLYFFLQELLNTLLKHNAASISLLQSSYYNINIVFYINFITGLLVIFILFNIYIQSTLVISKTKGPSETLRDIRTSTYRMCRIEKNTSRTTKFHK